MDRDEISTGRILDGRYRIEEKIGEGGMGVVLAAHHIGLGQRLAIKLMRADAEPVWRRRFLREAQAASRIDSEHVARVFDVGVTEEGVPFLVMEHLEGRDLAEVMAAGPLSVEDAITFTIHACRALAAAHDVGIVHRDVKPANLFLTRRDDGRPCVKLLDFGISKHQLEMGCSLTGTHAVLGSPQFMSPEQLASCRDVDARADVWSLGATLFELLTLEHVFEGSSLAELCTAIMRDPPRDLGDYRFDAPPELDAVIADCLEKDPARRIGSARELEERLTALLELPLSSRRPQPVPAERPPIPTIVMSADELVDETPSASLRPVVTERARRSEPPRSTRRPWRLVGASLVGLFGLAIALEAPAPPAPVGEATSAAEPRRVAHPTPPPPVEATSPPEPATPAPPPSHVAPSRFSDSGHISDTNRRAIEEGLDEARASLVEGDVARARSRVNAAMRRLRGVGVRPHESVSSLGARISLLQGEIEGAALRALLAEPLDREAAKRLVPELERLLGRAQIAYQLVNGWGVASFYRCAVAESAALNLAVGRAFATARATAQPEDAAWLVKAAVAWLRRARSGYRTALRVPAETTLCLADAKRGLHDTDRVIASLPR